MDLKRLTKKQFILIFASIMFVLSVLIAILIAALDLDGNIFLKVLTLIFVYGVVQHFLLNIYLWRDLDFLIGLAIIISIPVYFLVGRIYYDLYVKIVKYF